MAYTVREITDLTAFDQLVAFQEQSADEVHHRRERAGFAADGAMSRFHDGSRKRPRREPPRVS